MTLHPGRIMEADSTMWKELLLSKAATTVSVLMNFPARSLNASIYMFIGGRFCILTEHKL